MMKMHQAILSICLLLGFVIGAKADIGNRYGLPQLYHSEISAAEAYILTTRDRGNKSKNAFSNAVIIDVRRVSEHLAGHPPKSYSIPFPHIAGSAAMPNDSTNYIGYDLSRNSDICFVEGCENDTNRDGTLIPQDFVSYVESLFPDKDTYILTLCRTGYRSVQAANLLTRAGYTNIRNIWEGFIGQPKYVYDGGTVRTPPEQLDLNHDDNLDDTDKDGWAGFQGLPVSTKIHPRRIYSLYRDLYHQ